MVGLIAINRTLHFSFHPPNVLLSVQSKSGFFKGLLSVD